MEETFAGLIAEVEKAVRPLGFRVESADRYEKTAVWNSGQAGQTDQADDSEVRITIARKGKIG